LDLFCGAGGCSVGYHRAGFDVVGVDIEPHADYPYDLVIENALQVLADREFLDEFAAVHASPPCQRWSTATFAKQQHPDLLTPTRELLRQWGGLYVIENVPQAPLINPVMYCGRAMGLVDFVRHRGFESNAPLMSPGCACTNRQAVGVYGDHWDREGGWKRPDGTSRGVKATSIEHAKRVMGIDWMTTWDDLTDAIPPAYTEHIGAQLIDALTVRP
jgi:DNA (cytosine-5)-methyltransferase 1